MPIKQYRDYLRNDYHLMLRNEQRDTDREPLEGPLRYALCLGDQETPVKNIRPLDVSNRGLGLLCEQYVKPGDFLWLLLETGPIALEVVYCEPYLGLEHLFRCGLFLRDAESNLKELLT